MDNIKIIELLKVLKKIYVCEKAGFNSSFDLVQKINMDDLNTFLEENGVNTLDIVESCYNVKYVMEHSFIEKQCDKTIDGIKEYFDKFEGIRLSDNEAKSIYEKYLKN